MKKYCYNIAASLNSKKTSMKRVKKNAANFKKLERKSMQKINGGGYIEVIINGEKKLIWYPE